MKPKQVLNFLGGICLSIGVLLVLGGSSAWALFVVVGGLIIVIARRGPKRW
ncbi:hypothetical protein [Meiothermus sp.]|uniref:hypothetical protein n=1 Tax=Meiothermus sp. TaxID=1955249 RepID=UPI0021DC7BED|nr:hypothetical protein [Meiothermus sp.]GIW35704.1 MAG: hypothetical protein KatS3mg072_3037 [Meiothermus sp.]